MVHLKFISQSNEYLQRRKFYLGSLSQIKEQNKNIREYKRPQLIATPKSQIYNMSTNTDT